MGDAARILVVCTGNICRSPFIERLLQLRIGELRPYADWPVEVGSAGTRAVAGWAMDERAAQQLAAHGGDPSGFQARQLTAPMIESADLVLTATRRHRGEVGRLSPAARRRVFTLRDFADLLAGAEDRDAAAGGDTDDPRAWVASVADRAAARRGLTLPLRRREADIVDPIGREDEVFAAMAQQITSVLPPVARALVGGAVQG